MSINKVILVGNVGQDPAITNLDNGVKLANFSIATSESYKNKEGEKVTQTEWHKVVVWRGLAEVVEKYVKKGMQVYIEGKMKTRSWEKDGITHYITEIYADNLQMLGRKENNGDQAKSQQQAEIAESMGQPGNDLPF